MAQMGEKQGKYIEKNYEKSLLKEKKKSVGFEVTIICLKVKEAGYLKFMKFSNSVKLCQTKFFLYHHIWFHEEVSCRRFQYSSSKRF
jgi:hypothetical protein